jgi:hypothetical protein
MTTKLIVVSDSGRTWVGGKFAGESAEKIFETEFATLGAAITEYEKYRDHGFAGWERTVSLVSDSGELIVSKTLKRPTE